MININKEFMKNITYFYKNSYIPDEFFFQTVIMNSDFKNTVVNENYRLILVNKFLIF
jgi:hypothetical protein